MTGFQFKQSIAMGLLGLMALQTGSVFSQTELPPGYGNNPMDQTLADPHDDATPNEYYTNYSDQAMEAFRKGEYSKAIELLSKALQLSPGNTAILNNLAASYIQRGVYYQNSKKDFGKALDDYRMGMFYLVNEWPSGVPYKGESGENIPILKGNINGVLQALGVKQNDWKWHLKSAWDLRRKGLLLPALVEYNFVTDINPKSGEAWQAQGDIYSVRQKWDKALTAYQKAVDTASSVDDALYVKLGTAQLKSSHPDKAVDALNQAMAMNPKNKDALLALEQIWQKEIELNPRNLSAHLNLGAVYQQMGRFQDSYSQYQVSDRLSPGNPLVKLNLASLAIANNRWDEANQMVDAVLQIEPSNSKALMYKADILKKLGRGPESEQFLQRALSTAPDKKAAMQQLLAIYKEQGDPQKIKSGWAQYAGMFSNDADIQYQTGLTFHEQKDYEGAVNYYQAAVKLRPDFADAYANLGTALHALNRDTEAQNALQKAVKLNPELSDVNELLVSMQKSQTSQALIAANKYHQEGNYAQAVKSYQEALKQDPKNADILSRYGLALQALKRYTDAQAAYDKAIAASPDNALYYYYKATSYDEQNQLGEAKRLYEKALSLNPDLTQAKEALASVATADVDTQLNEALDAYNKKQYPKALTLIEESLKGSPDNATAYYYRGLVFDAQKKWGPAQAAYEKAVSIAPENSDAVYALAVVLDTQNKKPEAKAQYQKFLELMEGQSEDSFVKYAKERVSAL